MNIVEAFNYYFEMVAANSEDLKQEVYKLRYQVYCLEKEFLVPPVDNIPLEYDEYDAHACHYLIRHRATQCYIATARLILPNPDNPHKSFPMEEHSKLDDMAFLKPINRVHLAELSRFCVSKQFRRRANERNLIVTNEAEDAREKKSCAHITLALFACAVEMSAKHDIQYWYAIMEPALKCVVANLGVHFIQIGAPVNYHGMRIPCVIKVDDLLKSVAEKNIDYWQMLTGSLSL